MSYLLSQQTKAGEQCYHELEAETCNGLQKRKSARIFPTKQTSVITSSRSRLPLPAGAPCLPPPHPPNSVLKKTAESNLRQPFVEWTNSDKAMLHEAIFLATFCCETSCKKDFTCNTPVLQPATATKCCVARKVEISFV